MQNWFTRLLPTRPPNLERDLMAENESVCFPFDRGNTLHNQQENILLSLRERSQTSLSQKVRETRKKKAEKGFLKKKKCIPFPRPSFPF